MQVSRKVDYALRAVIYLSQQDSSLPLPAKEIASRRRIPHRLAVATHEVTMRQLQAFRKAVPSIEGWEQWEQYSPDENCPWLIVDWYDAARYCRWLSEQEGIPEEQMCFPKLDKIKEGLTLPADYAQRTGYRLPTEGEWEYACRAGATTSRYYGDAEELLGQYAWFIKTAQDRSWPVGSLKPNDWGLFDMLGNAFEWTADEYDSYPSGTVEDALKGDSVSNHSARVLRGDSWNGQSRYARSASRGRNQPDSRDDVNGFRVVRVFGVQDL